MPPLRDDVNYRDVDVIRVKILQYEIETGIIQPMQKIKRRLIVNTPGAQDEIDAPKPIKKKRKKRTILGTKSIPIYSDFLEISWTK